MNERRPRLSLRVRVILVTIGLQMIFIAAFGGIQVYNEYRAMREFVRDSSVTFAGCIAHSSGMALSTGDNVLLARSLFAAQEQHGDDVKYVLMQGSDGKVLASTLDAIGGLALTDPISQRALESEHPIVQEVHGSTRDLYQQCAYDVAVPIVDHGARVATLRLGVSSRSIHERVWNVISRGAWMAALALLVGGALAIAVDRKMQRSFRQLIGVTRSIASGDLSQRVTINTGDELQDLGQTFNEMTEQLAASRDELRRWAGELEQKVRLRTQELEAERQKLDGIVSGIGAGLILRDRHLRAQWANLVASRWLGPSPSPTSAGTCGSFCLEKARCQDCAAGRAVISGQVEQCDTVTETPAGHRRFLHITASPIRDQHGEVAQVVELVQDVTEKRQMEQQLLQASRMVAMGELAAAVAHEINNPLAVIGASVERMQRLMCPAVTDKHLEKFPSYLESMQRHVYRCKETIEKLLGFARQKEPRSEPADLNHILQEAVALIAPRAASAGVQVAADFGADVPLLQTDAHELVQVFVNLLTNAVDACVDGGQVCVSSQHDGTQLVAQVTDTGCGIAPEHLQAIFDPFFTTKPEGKGTGLGLPICRRIVNRLGGGITVHSALRVGTTFTVSLPLGKPPATMGA